MTQLKPVEFLAQNQFAVFPAACFRVTSGVNHGEPVGPVDDVNLGDSYMLKRSAEVISLDMCQSDRDAMAPLYSIVNRSGVEMPGTKARVASRLTFMTHIGASVDALVIACDAPVARHYLYPLGPIEAGTEYMLIAAETEPGEIPLADLTGMSFGRGTRITMSDGSQRRVETLVAGERVLTRDHGMQKISWIGKRTVQAVGDFAPVVISPGALGNVETLTVSQQHRMLISDWRAEVIAGSRDVLISASDLVNDDTIYLRSGGFVEYTQLVFDQHQILYAEGVPTESLQLTRDIVAGLPPEAATEVLALFPDLPTAEPTYSRVPLDSKMAQNVLRQTGRV